MAFSSRSAIPETPDPRPDPVPVLHDLAVTDTTGWPGYETLERSALEALVHDGALRYVPDSLGSPDARACLARFQQPHDPERWVLTASSSEAYALLFQLLCDPGSRVATPRPGYPLVDELGRFHDVAVSSIPLRLDGDDWKLDLGWTERRLREGVRALVLIQPANPTGWILSDHERERVLALCQTYKVPLVSDEVFEAWAGPGFRSLATQSEVLCFTLGGLSKLLGLPHLKLGWIRVTGPAQEVQEAMARLAILNDALLSASTPVQNALPVLLADKPHHQAKILERLTTNRELWSTLGTRLPASFQVLGGSSGWFGMVLWNGPWSEQEVCSSIAQAGIRVLPGYLFDLPRAGFVVSLISPSSSLLHALSLLVDLLISLEP